MADRGALALADAAARCSIVEDLERTLFVDAGAGSGKTTALVRRVVALVESGTAELRSIAAITFTEKAGAELRDRLRRELTARAADSPRCAAAVDQLDGAAIGTLHAFAQRILSEHPVEARLPPRIEVLDEVSSGLEFERRWRSFRDELLSDLAVQEEIVILTAAGVRPDALRLLAVAFGDNWDLVATRVPDSMSDRDPATATVAAALDAIDAICRVRFECREPDALSAKIETIAQWAAEVRTLTDEADIIERLQEPPPVRVGGLGKAANWADKAAVRDEILTIGDIITDAKNAIATACIGRLAVALRRFTLAAAEERRAAGRLEFHDLLVMARALLRDPDHAAVRAHLHGTYQRILLDEFQDTDPIQIELAVRIAADDPKADGEWDEVELTPGHLFLVGDPKQSIYRFRRADIALFRHVRDQLGPALELVTNFRSVRPVIDWVNTTFGELMAGAGDFVRLEAERDAPPVGPPVAAVGVAELTGKPKADEIRAAEAGAVAAAITRAVTEGWSVGDGDGWRAARLGDIAILVPARTSLPFLEDALEQAGIPFRAEASSLVYASRAVRDLVMVLRAADDPTDHLRVVAALRTPLLGCGDDDLYRHRVERRGTWNYLADQEGSGPVVEGLAYLRSIHEDRRWRTASELLNRIAVDRRAFELGIAEGRPRDVWRRLRFVIDQARAWHEAAGGSLRHYLQWVEQQTSEGARVAEAVLPETDDDAVRIMTIHAAKGLEFPITVVSGLSTAPQYIRASVEVVFPATGEVGYRVGSKIQTPAYEAWKPVDEQMADDERIRLLYVACTRACDHLIVSVHRKARDRPETDPAKLSNAELLFGTGGLPEVGEAGDARPAPAVAAVGPLMPFEEWAAEHDAVIERAAQPTTVAATALGHAPDDDGLKKAPRDLDLPPWLKGRYGTAVGRAVHGVLQTIDLATGARIGDLVASQCEAEAIPGQTATVRGLVEHALAATSVREASVSPHWRELYACTPIGGGRLLEGYVDLLYRGPDGLVVVDYKTAATADPADLDRRADVYRLQGASYAVTVGAATDEPVVRVTFLFLTPEGAIERHLPDLAAAMAEITQSVDLPET